MDCGGESRGVGSGGGYRGAAGEGFDHRCVPDVVQVRVFAVVGYADGVAADVEGFVVEGLVDVADELGRG